MMEVMQILAEASGGSGQPEFASTHPDPENRIARIQETIDSADTVCNRS
jgi:predicted Zn-dependent protease